MLALPCMKARRHTNAHTEAADATSLEITVTPDDKSQRARSPRVLSPSGCGFSQACLLGTATALVISGSVGTVLLTRFVGSRCYLINWSADYSDFWSVPEVFTQVELNHHIEVHQPALLRGMLAHWPAIRKWTPEWFGQTLAERRVEIYFWGRSGADWKRSRIFEVTLNQFAKLVAHHNERIRDHGGDLAAAGPAPYLQEDESLFDEFSYLLMPDVMNLPFRPFVERSRDEAFTEGMDLSHALWIGPTGARTGIHWDSVDALLHQIHGMKRVMLWPPSARSFLYPSAKYNHGAELSDVDASYPNLTRFPRFAQARTISTLLDAGSALYIPAGWWHAVESLDTTISLALRSQSKCERRAAWADDALLWLHRRGLYKPGDCVCHPSARDARRDAEQGMGTDRVDAALRKAGINPEDAEYSPAESSDIH